MEGEGRDAMVPQLEHLILTECAAPGDRPEDCEDGETELVFAFRVTIRLVGLRLDVECGLAEGEKVKVKNLWSSIFQILMTIFAWIWPIDIGCLRADLPWLVLDVMNLEEITISTTVS